MRLPETGVLQKEIAHFFTEQMPILTLSYDVINYPYYAIRSDTSHNNSKEFDCRHLSAIDRARQERQWLISFLQNGQLFYGFDTAPETDIDETQLLSYFLDGVYSIDRGLVPAEYDWLGVMMDASWFYMYKFSKQQLQVENYLNSDLKARKQPMFIDIQNKVFLDGSGRGIKIIMNSKAELKKYLSDF